MRKHLLSVSGLLLVMLVMIYPFVLHLDAYIPGFFSTDEPYSALWDSWRIKYSFSHHLSLKHTNLIAYPFGADLYASGYFSYLWLGLVHLLSLLTTLVLTYNLQVISNLFLSIILTYLLVYYLSKNRLSAIFASIIFGLCPYQFMRIWQHLGLSYNQWIPLALFTAILLRERNSRRNAFLVLLSILLALSFDFSVMYFAIVTIMTFFVFVLFYNWKIKLFKHKQLLRSDLIYLKRIIIITFFAFFVLSGQFIPIIIKRLNLSSLTAAGAHNPYYRPFEDLFSQSAKPLSYLLPAVVHPLFGNFTEQFIGTSSYGDSFTEHTLYLGWIPLVLAFIAFRRWKTHRKIRGQSPSGTVPSEDFYIGFFIFLAIVAWLFSQPPWWKIGPIKIYMPSFFMYKLLPMYRAYCRFGIVVMLAVAVLAGFGLKIVLEKFKTQGAKIAIATLFSGLVLFEFWNYPPFKVIDVSRVPLVYYWLKEKPEDLVIAEYPLDIKGPNELYKFYQTKHEKKIINGTIPGTYANKVAQQIIRLSEPNTAGILKRMGAKYVLVHKDDYLRTDLIEDREDLEMIPRNPGLKLIKNFPSQECPRKDMMCVEKSGPIDVYEIIGRPIQPKI